MLALILNHPFLLSEMEEDLAALELVSPDLDRLSRAILKALTLQPDLEAAALKGHLNASCFAGIVERVLSPEVLVHARFARPDASVESARDGWLHMKNQFQRRRSSTEIKEAVANCAADPTAETWGRVEQLQQTELESKDQDDGVA